MKKPLLRNDKQQLIKKPPGNGIFELHLRSRHPNDIRASVSRRALMTYSVCIRDHDVKLANGLLDAIEREVIYERKIRGGKELDTVEALSIINMQMELDKVFRKKEKESKNDEEGYSTDTKSKD